MGWRWRGTILKQNRRQTTTRKTREGGFEEETRPRIGQRERERREQIRRKEQNRQGRVNCGGGKLGHFSRQQATGLRPPRQDRWFPRIRFVQDKLKKKGALSHYITSRLFDRKTLACQFIKSYPSHPKTLELHVYKLSPIDVRKERPMQHFGPCSW